jgi:hypothetical protein
MLVLCWLQTASAAPAATEPVERESTVEVQSIEDTVRVINPTDFTIMVTVKAEADGHDPVTVTFGPIEPGQQGEGVLSVWNPGRFHVTASWEWKEETTTSRPYTATLVAGRPVTPVTLTLNHPYSDGSLGVWNSVIWDEPKAAE